MSQMKRWMKFSHVCRREQRRRNNRIHREWRYYKKLYLDGVRDEIVLAMVHDYAPKSQRRKYE